jgi:hypothetical protein
MDPAQDICSEERFRVLVGCVEQENAIVLDLASPIDEPAPG